MPSFAVSWEAEYPPEFGGGRGRVVSAKACREAETDRDAYQQAARETDEMLKAERAKNEQLRYALKVAHAHWDADRDVKVGKTLILALRGEPIPSAPEIPAPTQGSE